MSAKKIVIVGIGDDGVVGLTAAARQKIADADLILGAPATLRLLDGAAGEKVALEPEMEAAARQVREALKAERPVLVSPGDPLFYGITRYLCDRLGKDQFDVLPHVSSMQLAFARIKESWEDAYLTSLSGKPLESVIERIRTASKVGLFSNEHVPPSRLAKMLIDRGIDYFRAYVCENLGSPDERVTQAGLHDLIGMEFSPHHVMVLVRQPNRPDSVGQVGRHRLFGNPDGAFAQSQPKRGLITTAEVRAIALAELELHAESIVWDIGAGSGSVAIEAARLAPEGMVYAIEPDAADIVLIESNAEALGVTNLKAVAGRAPEALAALPAPDAIFIGGTGRQVEPVIEGAYRPLKPGGRIVINIATIDALASAYSTLKALANEVQAWQVGLLRGVEQMERLRFEAIPVSFLIAATKPLDQGD